MAPRMGAVVGLLCLALSMVSARPGRELLAPSAPAPVSADEYFVQVRDGQFVAGCDKFMLAGWNQWEVVEAAAGAPYLSGASLPANSTGPELVRSMLDKGQRDGFNVLRAFAFAVNAQYAAQTAPGKYNEAALRGLDYLVDEARKRGLKLILTFTSNWTPTGGVPEYLKWGGSDKQQDFFTSPAIKGMYKDFVKTLTNRVNSINGRTYKDDPAIMAWDLLNEPRCNGCPPGTVANWFDEMAKYTKTQDPNHLVTTGEEGFYGCCKNPANPGQPWTEWAAEEGQDFIKDHSSPAIDFATIHAWVDNWQEVSEEFFTRWVSDHAKDAREVLKKPLVVEEFGKWVGKNLTIGTSKVDATLEERNAWFPNAYAAISKLEQQPGSGLQGALFWQWYNQGQEAPTSEGGGRGLFGIYDSDAAFKPILQNAQLVQTLNGPLPGCSLAAHKAAPVAAAADCFKTWQNNEPGTGMEGANCDEPINECVRGTATCDPNAACIDTKQGYSCQCYWGYEGSGKTCTPNQRALTQLKSLYWTEEKGLSCDPGEDVAWPSSAPGYLYDPLDSFAFFNTSGGGLFGSRTNVTLTQCQIACQEADACESFVYNNVLMQCFLKKSQCPMYNSCGGEEVVCASSDDRGGSYTQACGTWHSWYRLDMDVDAACGNYMPAPGAEARPEVGVESIFRDFEAQYEKQYGRTLVRVNPAAETSPAQPAKPAAPKPASPDSVQLLEQSDAPKVQAAAGTGSR